MARAGLDPDPLKLTVRLHLAVIGACARDFRTAIEELHAVLDIEAEHRVAHSCSAPSTCGRGGDQPMTPFDAAARMTPDHSIRRFDRI